MSRVGMMPIAVPSGVTVKIGTDNTVSVKGPKGPELSRQMPGAMVIELDDNVVTVSRPSEQRQHRALHGLTRSLIANMVLGVTDGFKKELEFFGLGYRADVQGKDLVLQIGYSHECRVPVPAGIDATVEGNKITISGADKELVGQVAANIRKLRKMSVYLPRGQDLRGIRYVGEQTRFKAGKAGKVGV